MSKSIDPTDFPRPIGSDRLDTMGCSGCGETHEHAPMEMMSKCHPSAGTRCSYQHGILYIACKRCDKPIIALVVGRGPSSSVGLDGLDS